jgi:hypothetical protein
MNLIDEFYRVPNTNTNLADTTNTSHTNRMDWSRNATSNQIHQSKIVDSNQGKLNFFETFQFSWYFITIYCLLFFRIS